MPWWLAAGGGAGLVAAAGWVVIAASTVIGQVVASGGVDAASFTLATHLWLLAHGEPVVIDGVRVTLAPLSLTVLVGVGLHGVAGYAARQAQLGRPGRAWSAAERRRLCLSLAGVLAGVYAVVLTAVLVLSGVAAESGLRAVAVAIGLAGLIGLAGARQAVGWRPQQAWPPWARAIPRAVLAAVLVLALGGVAATVTGLLTHHQMVTALTAQLAPDGTGALLLTLLQGAYLVNVVLWATAWTLGAGFSLGQDSFVSLMGNQVEVLPSFPLIGAIPQTNPAPWSNLAWLVWGVLAGVMAAVIVLRSRRRARFDETALVGGLSGVLAGLACWLLSVLARGDLGTVLLTGLGPRLTELAVLAPTLLGLSGLVAGLILGLSRPPLARAELGPVGADDPAPWADSAASPTPADQVDPAAGQADPVADRVDPAADRVDPAVGQTDLAGSGIAETSGPADPIASADSADPAGPTDQVGSVAPVDSIGTVGPVGLVGSVGLIGSVASVGPVEPADLVGPVDSGSAIAPSRLPTAFPVSWPNSTASSRSTKGGPSRLDPVAPGGSTGLGQLLRPAPAGAAAPDWAQGGTEPGPSDSAGPSAPARAGLRLVEAQPEGHVEGAPLLDRDGVFDGGPEGAAPTAVRARIVASGPGPSPLPAPSGQIVAASPTSPAQRSDAGGATLEQSPVSGSGPWAGSVPGSETAGGSVPVSDAAGGSGPTAGGVSSVGSVSAPEVAGEPVSGAAVSELGGSGAAVSDLADPGRSDSVAGRPLDQGQDDGRADQLRPSFWEARRFDRGVRRVGAGTRLFRLRQAGAGSGLNPDPTALDALDRADGSGSAAPTPHPASSRSSSEPSTPVESAPPQSLPAEPVPLRPVPVEPAPTRSVPDGPVLSRVSLVEPAAPRTDTVEPAPLRTTTVEPAAPRTDTVESAPLRTAMVEPAYPSTATVESVSPERRPVEPPVVAPARPLALPDTVAMGPSAGRRSETAVPPNQPPLDFTDPDDWV
jgi:hypothetical protein